MSEHLNPPPADPARAAREAYVRLLDARFSEVLPMDVQLVYAEAFHEAIQAPQTTYYRTQTEFLADTASKEELNQAALHLKNAWLAAAERIRPTLPPPPEPSAPDPAEPVDETFLEEHHSGEPLWLRDGEWNRAHWKDRVPAAQPEPETAPPDDFFSVPVPEDDGYRPATYDDYSDWE